MSTISEIFGSSDSDGDGTTAQLSENLLADLGGGDIEMPVLSW